MPRIRNFAFDCADPYALALFWAEVMGHPVDPESGPGDREVGIRLPGSRDNRHRKDFRFPLGSRQVVRHRILIPAFVGSIPTSPAIP